MSFRGKLLRDFFRELGGLGVQLVGPVRNPVFRQHDPVGAERVRFNDMTAGFKE